MEGINSHNLPTKTSSEGGSTLIIKAESPINIALIKYWGKVESKHIIPANSSLSITIDMAQMKSETTVTLKKAREGQER